TWSGECVRTLREARRHGVPSVIEVPTWHRHKGKAKSASLTRREREDASAGGLQGWKNRLLVSRQQTLEEDDRADLVLVLSGKAEETFLTAGIAPEKLFRHQRGVDVERFTPAPAPTELFRAVFVGALIKRKGVHLLLETWRKLALKNAELVLVGSPHPEMEPYLGAAGAQVEVAGFVRRVEECYRAAWGQVMPRGCGGGGQG